VQYLPSGPYETGVEYRAPQDVLERVLKEGTARPWLPYG
jgi:hypothetical protein